MQVGGECAGPAGDATGPGRRRERPSRRAWIVIASLTLLAGLAVRPRLAEPVDLSGDEAEYCRIAAQVAVHGVLSDNPLGATPGKPTAFREPLYPLLLGLATRLETDASRPGAATEALLPVGSARRTLFRWQWTLLFVAALAAAWWALAASGSAAAGAGAAVAIVTSPALVQTSGAITTEALAAPLALVAAIALAAAVRSRRTPWLVAAAGAFGLLAVTRLGYLPLLALAAGLVAAAWPSGQRRRVALLFLALSALPVALWGARNLVAFGAPTLDEGRGAFNLLVRAELDRQLRGDERPAALLAWIPPAWGITSARERYPSAAILRPSPRNRDYYVTRAMEIWQSEVERFGSRLDAAPAVRRQALSAVAEAPGPHLLVSAIVGWRTLFAERGALSVADPDLALAVGLALHALLLFWAARALARRDLPGLALALIPLGGWILHALLTEGRERFQLPALPALWLLAALAIAEATRRVRTRRQRGQ